MPDREESIPTPPERLNPEECIALVESFRQQVLDFIAHLPRFPDWEQSAMALDVEALHWATIAGCLADDLAAEGDPGKVVAVVESGSAGGVLGTIYRALESTQDEKLATTRDVIFNLEDGRRAAARRVA